VQVGGGNDNSVAKVLDHIFAAAFFYRYYTTKDPWEAGRFAVLLASWSVTKQHLQSIPTSHEIKKAKIELMAH